MAPFILSENTWLLKGAFNNYIDRRGWVGGQLNVYAHKVKDLFYSLYWSTRGGWVVKIVQKSVYVVIECPLSESC